jgi:hypothetical protein
MLPVYASRFRLRVSRNTRFWLWLGLGQTGWAPAQGHSKRFLLSLLPPSPGFPGAHSVETPVGPPPRRPSLKDRRSAEPRAGPAPDLIQRYGCTDMPPFDMLASKRKPGFRARRHSGTAPGRGDSLTTRGGCFVVRTRGRGHPAMSGAPTMSARRQSGRQRGTPAGRRPTLARRRTVGGLQRPVREDRSKNRSPCAEHVRRRAPAGEGTQSVGRSAAGPM